MPKGFRLFWAAALLFAASGSGCDSWYEIEIHNVGAERIDEVAAFFGEHRVPAGAVPAGVRKSYLDADFPIPEYATVQWRNASGERRALEVPIRSRVPERESGTVLRIRIEIDDDDSVAVSAVNHRYEGR